MGGSDAYKGWHYQRKVSAWLALLLVADGSSHVVVEPENEEDLEAVTEQEARTWFRVTANNDMRMRMMHEADGMSFRYPKLHNKFIDIKTCNGRLNVIKDVLIPLDV